MGAVYIETREGERQHVGVAQPQAKVDSNQYLSLSLSPFVKFMLCAKDEKQGKAQTQS